MDRGRIAEVEREDPDGPLDLMNEQCCEREPFLHVLVEAEQEDESFFGHGETIFLCTTHVRAGGLVRLDPVVHEERPMVHEVSPACFDDESIWHMDENRCVVEEDEPLNTELEAELVHHGDR